MPPKEAGTSLLRRLFEAAGYRLEDRPAGLLAVRSRDHRAILLLASPVAPPEVESEFPSDTLHRTLVYSEDPGPAARSMAAGRGMEILDSATLGPGMGELLLMPLDLVSPVSSVPPDEDLALPEQILPPGERVVRPRLSEGDAVTLSGVDSSRYLLRLVPFYLAPYRVRTPTAHGNRGPVSQHLVAVNALSGRVEVWEEADRELVADVEGPHDRLDPLRPEAECLELADSELRRRHTVEVDHVEQHAGAVVIERRRVPPGAKDLRIGRAVLVYVPYWYIESVEGRVILDAVTGQRLPPTENDDGVGVPSSL